MRDRVDEVRETGLEGSAGTDRIPAGSKELAEQGGGRVDVSKVAGPVRFLGPELRNTVGAAVQTLADAGQAAREMAGDSLREIRAAADDAVDQVTQAFPTFEESLEAAARLPGTSVDRTEFLRRALSRYPLSVQRTAILQTPQRAGVESRKLWKLAGKAMGREARRTAVVSAAAGIAGGPAASVALPADTVQLYAHLIRAAQMLSYLYGWRDVCAQGTGEGNAVHTRGLMVFLGVMAGVETADAELLRLSGLRQRNAVLAELETEESAAACEKIQAALSDLMGRRAAGKAVERALPVVGGLVAGRFGYADFSSSWKRLRLKLAELDGR